VHAACFVLFYLSRVFSLFSTFYGLFVHGDHLVNVIVAIIIAKSVRSADRPWHTSPTEYATHLHAYALAETEIYKADY